MRTTLSITKVSLKLTTNCEGCGRMFKFESNDVADALDMSRIPTRCAECRVPTAVALPPKKKRRGKR